MRNPWARDRLEALVVGGTETDPVRDRAVEALATIAASESFALMVVLLDHDRTARQASRYLARIGTPNARDALAAQAQQPNHRSRWAAVALAATGDPRAAEPLLQLILERRRGGIVRAGQPDAPVTFHTDWISALQHLDPASWSEQLVAFLEQLSDVDGAIALRIDEFLGDGTTDAEERILAAQQLSRSVDVTIDEPAPVTPSPTVEPEDRRLAREAVGREFGDIEPRRQELETELRAHVLSSVAAISTDFSGSATTSPAAPPRPQ